MSNHDAAYWYRRAEEARQSAEAMKEPEERQAVLSVVEAYVALAKMAEGQPLPAHPAKPAR